MKSFGQSRRWGGHLLAGLVAAAMMGGAVRAWSVQALILTNSHPHSYTNSTGQAAYPYMYSSGLSDILKMVDAKVDPEVIKAYIKNSGVPYNPSAAEVVALKDRGVSPDILTALLQRGAELRAQEPQMMQAQYPGAPGTAMPNVPMAPNPYDYGADYGAYPVDYGYGYPGYGYPGAYSWWVNYWPWWSGWPGFGFGFDQFGHHHGDFHHFNNFNRFNNFNHFNHFNRFNDFNVANFQSFSSSPFNNARFQNFDFNRGIGAFSPVGFNNRAFAVPRVGLSQLGVPSRAIPPSAFASGTAPAAFIGAPGGTAGTIAPPGVNGVRGGQFAFRSGGMGMGMRGGGGMVHGGGGGGMAHGGGGGGHR